MLFTEVAFSWTVTDTNRAPVVNDPGAQVGGEGDSINVLVGGSDPDGDTLVFSATGLPAGLYMDSENGIIAGSINFTASAGSPYSVTVRVQDPGGLFSESTFSWAVADTPTLIDVVKTSDVAGRAQPGDTVEYTIVVTNPEATPATLVAVTDVIPPGTSYVGGSGTFQMVDAARDSFESGGYSGDDGTIPWTGDWIELDGGGPDADLDGIISESSCAGGSCFFVRPSFVSGVEGAERMVDLSGAVSATLSYQAVREIGFGSVEIRVSGNGQPWTTLKTYTLNASDPVPVAESFDISIFAAADTMIRFEAATPGVGRLFIDDVAISTGVLTGPTGPLPGLLSGITLAPGESLTVTFSVTVDDPPPGSGVLSNTAIVTSAEAPGGVQDTVVDAVNRYPAFDQDLGDRSDPEGTVVFVSAGALDPDGDDRTWSAVGLPPGISIAPASGLLSGTIDYAASVGSPYAVTVTVEDVDGLDDVDTFTWTVTDTNRAPVVVDPGAQVAAEGDVVSMPVSGSDPDGDGLTWSSSDLPPGLSIDPGSGLVSGTLTYSASPGSPYAVTVRATDDGSPVLFTEVPFIWTVSNTNRNPVVVDPGAQSSAEGDTVSLGISASDPDGDGLTWSALGLPAGLSIDPGSGLVSGTITYAASPGSPFSVTVTAVDDGTPALLDSVVFQWTVADTNRNPVVSDPGAQSDAEGDVIALPMSAVDPDGDGVSWSAAGLPPGLSINPVSGFITGTIAFTASPGSPYAVTVTATDDGSPVLDDQVAFSWTIIDTNRAPNVNAPVDEVSAEADAIFLAMVGWDSDGDGITWSATGLPDGFSIDPGTGIVSGTISYDAAPGSVYAVTVRATDGGAPVLFTEVGFSWTVSDTNRAPLMVNPGDQGSGEGDPVTLVVAGSDPDGDGLAWSATGLPAGLSIDPGSGAITGTVAFSASPGSPYGVTVRATDTGTPVLFSEVSFDWVIADTNRAPVAVNPGARSSAEGDVVSLVIAGSDPDADGLTWSAVGLPLGLSIDPGSGAISGTISMSAAPGSPYTTQVTVTDDGAPNLAATVTFGWDVANTNQAPVVTSLGPRSSVEGDGVTLGIVGSDPDGQALAWVATGLPDGLFIDPATGVISGAIGYDAAAVSPFTVTLTASDGGTPLLDDQVTFTWTVANTNRSPVVVDPGARSDAEGSAISLAIPASDPDGQTLTWVATGLPDGLAIDPATGIVSGSIGYSAAASSPFAVVVTASDGGTPLLDDQATFTWTVLNTNLPPSAPNPGAQASAEGDTVSLAIAGSDPDGDSLTYSSTDLPDGLVIDPATGAISGIIGFDAALVSPFSVLVTVTDDGAPNLSAFIGFTWDVSDTNRASIVISPGSQASAEGDVVSLAIAGSDPDGDSYVYAVAGLPTGLAIDAASGLISGSIDYDASPASPYTVTVTVTDAGTPSLGSQTTFDWAVAETNRSPIAEPVANRSDAEGDSISLTAVAADPDTGTTLTWSALALPPSMTLDPATGAITGTLGFAESGTYPVTLTVTDDDFPALSDQVTFLWVVGDVNRAPAIAAPGDRTSAEGDAVTLALVASDPDGHSVTWSATGLPDGLEIDPATGRISGTVGYTAAGPHTVVVEVWDFGNPSLSGERTFTWTVINTNRAPVLASPLDRSSAEGDAIVLAITGSDPDSDAITWRATGLPGALTIDQVTGQISGSIAYDQAGTHSVTVRATDGGTPSLSTEIAFQWVVADTNRAPDVEPISDLSVTETSQVSIPVEAADPDGDAIAFSAAGLPENVVLDPETGSITGVPGYDAAGTYPITVSVSDDGDPSLATEVTFDLTIGDVNRGPVIGAISDVTANERVTLTVRPTASDPDGDKITWSATGLPAGLAVSPATGVISGAVATEGSYSISVTVTDDGIPVMAVSTTFTMAVLDVNRRPVVDFLSDGTGTAGDEESAGVSGADPDGDPIEWLVLGLPPGIDFDPIEMEMSGTLTEAGIFGVTVEATDPDGLTGTATFQWTVEGQPGAPHIDGLAEQRSTIADRVELTVTASHPDDDTLTFSATGMPSGIAIDRPTGVISGVVGEIGEFDVLVRVTDTLGASASSSFRWVVLPVPDQPPTAFDDELTIVAGSDSGRISIDVLANDTDPENQMLTIVSEGPARSGEVSVEDGLILFTPPDEWWGVVIFPYTIADEAGNEDSATVSITVEPPLTELVEQATALLQLIESSIGVPEPSGVLLGSMAQSLYVLRVPLTLLGSAVLTSLLFGGLLNLGLLFQKGFPWLIARRAGRIMAIVLAAKGQRIDAFAEPGSGEVVHRFLSTDAALRASAGSRSVDGAEWISVGLPDGGDGWVDAFYLTEHVDNATFASDGQVVAVLDDFGAALRSREPFDDLVSERGLWVAHHGSPVRFSPDEIPGILDDPKVQTWKGRNPAYPDTVATFDVAVAASVFEAWNHPNMSLVANQPAVPSTVIPVEFSNCNAVSIGADLQGRERLDQIAWLVFLAYEHGEPRIIGLVKEG
ncbi:putative Ig domain-containing protein [bacterium]|nr:putative Ig domain-containing protein [bacterium]